MNRSRLVLFLAMSVVVVGVVAGLGALFLLIARSEASFAAQAPVVAPFAVVVAALYLWTGLRYWFRTPIIGCAIALASFLGSWALLLLEGR